MESHRKQNSPNIGSVNYASGSVINVLIEAKEENRTWRRERLSMGEENGLLTNDAFGFKTLN